MSEHGGGIEVIVDHRQDMLFNRQLRIHRQNKEFEQCFCATNQLVAESFVPLWASTLGLTENQNLMGLVLKLTIDNFYLQVTEKTLNRQWLLDYFEELKRMVEAFRKTGPATLTI